MTTFIPLPGSAGCAQCGRGPARAHAYREVTGTVVWFTIRTLGQPLCQDCSISVGRQAQCRTLLVGWWSVVSFVLTPFVVIWNAVGLVRARRAPRPTKSPQSLGGAPPLTRPALDPGLSIWRRPRGVAGVAVTLAITGAVSAAAVADRSMAWEVGACVRGGSTVVPVDCESHNDGRIVAAVVRRAECPVITDAVVDDGDDVYCIDTDL